MVKIIWSPLARENLKKIIDYIALDSPIHAKKFLKQVLDKVRNLEKLPNMGRNVPELPFSDEREIFHKSYRIIYEYIEDIKEQYPVDIRQEVAFVGRSNVGKSSMINAICNRKGI